jgi:iron complex outermembrane receptor protein
MKLNTFNYNAKYHLPKVGAFESILACKECIKNVNSGEEYLIPMLRPMILEFWYKL